MAHLHGQVVVAHFQVELRHDEAVEVVWRVDVRLQSVAVAVAPIRAVHHVDPPADVPTAAIGLDLALPAEPQLVHFILVAAVVADDRPVPSIRRAERVEGHALFQPAVLLDPQLLDAFRFRKAPRLRRERGRECRRGWFRGGSRVAALGDVASAVAAGAGQRFGQAHRPQSRSAARRHSLPIQQPAASAPRRPPVSAGTGLPTLVQLLQLPRVLSSSFSSVSRVKAKKEAQPNRV